MHKLFAEQLMVTREAIRDKIQTQFVEVDLGPETQDAAAEEEEEERELLWASVKDVN